MPRKRYYPKQISAHLREAEMPLAKDQTTGEVCRHPDITEPAYYRGRKEYAELEMARPSV